MKNQRDRIIAYINQHGSITNVEAQTKIKVGRLSARICELGKQGILFPRITVYGKNEYGPTHYTRYFSEEEFKMGNHWISVKTMMPVDGVKVIVCCQTKKGVQNINMAYQSNGFWHGNGSMSGVTHWQPLPEPPKKED